MRSFKIISEAVFRHSLSEYRSTIFTSDEVFAEYRSRSRQQPKSRQRRSGSFVRASRISARLLRTELTRSVRRGEFRLKRPSWLLTAWKAF